MARRPTFSGVGVSLLTLFHGNGELDAPATASLAAKLVEHGIRCVVVADWAGEGMALSTAERDELLDAVRAAVPASSGVPVIASTGSASARQAAQLTVAACEHGADGVLVHSPPLSSDPRLYYEEVKRAARDRPVIAAHDPSVSWPGLKIEDLPHLHVAGVADSSGEPVRLLETLELVDHPVYVGSAAVLALAGPAGATGAILVLANADPERCVAAFGGNGTAQRELTKEHIAVHVDFPKRVKALTARRFGTSTVSRMG